MNRKDFLHQGAFALVGCMGLTNFLSSCGTASYYAKHSLANNSLQIPLTEFIKLENGKTTYRKFVLVKAQQHNFPICLFRLNETTYSAVLMECTHKSCELHNQGDFLMCPCHGSEFSNIGKVQNPPAEEDLKTFKVHIQNDNLYIEL
jgi:cytochrome b6-f complex iron-sulfur subunit